MLNPIRWLTLAALAAALPAQPIFIVDELNGAGAHFTDLPPAIAAVPDGAVLVVRPGWYTPFSLSKGLTIAGEDAATVLIYGNSLTPIVISNTVLGQRILIRNLTLAYGSPTIEVRDTKDAVIFENIETSFPSFAGFDFKLQRNSNVQFHRCQLTDSTAVPGWNAGAAPRISAIDTTLQISHSTITGLDGRVLFFGQSPDGTPALELTRSRCVAVASTLTGGVGGSGCSNLGGCSSTAGGGGPGAILDDHSTLLALRTPVRGNDGLDENSRYGGRVQPSDGGDGVRVLRNSFARFEGAEPIAGAGGAGTRPGQPGMASVVDASSTLIVHPHSDPPSGEILGTQATGQTVRFTLDARPASTGWLVLSYAPGLVPLEPLAPGSLLATFAVTIGPQTVPASGTLEIPITIPATWPIGQTYYGQFVTLESGTALWVSNSFPWHTNR